MKNILVVLRETFPTNILLSEKNLKENLILNPYDEYALFQAKKLKEKLAVKIFALFLGQRESQYNLRTALALGADEGIFVYCPNISIKELAKKLALELKKEDFISIFMGIRDVNNDNEALASYLSVYLETLLYPHILSVDYENEKFCLKQEREETIDSLEVENFGIFAFSQNVYEPEYPSISSIMSIKDKAIKTINCEARVELGEKKIVFQDVNRKQNILKNLTAEEGSEEILNYLKTWKLLD